jgi:hypothetical protein
LIWLARAIRINPAAGASLPFLREPQYDVFDMTDRGGRFLGRLNFLVIIHAGG